MLLIKSTVLGGILLAVLPTMAQDLTVNFNATIQEPTCNVYIAASGDGSGAASSAEIKFNSVQLDKIIDKESSAQQAFALKMDSCSAGLTNLVTTIKSSKTLLNNLAIGNSNTGAGSAQEIGVTIARDSVPDSPFTLNSTSDPQRLVWSSSEVAAKLVKLRATLVADAAPTLGSYTGTATFETTYD